MAELLTTSVAILTGANYYLVVVFGATVLYVLNRLNNRQPFSFCRAIDVKLQGRPILIIVDMLVSSAFGAGVVVLLMTLGSPQQAMAAGLGLTGVLSTFGKDA